MQLLRLHELTQFNYEQLSCKRSDKMYQVNCEKIQGERTGKKSKKYRDVGFHFSIVGFFGFYKYRVGVGFGLLKYRDIGVG